MRGGRSKVRNCCACASLLGGSHDPPGYFASRRQTCMIKTRHRETGREEERERETEKGTSALYRTCCMSDLLLRFRNRHEDLPAYLVRLLVVASCWGRYASGHGKRPPSDFVSSTDVARRHWAEIATFVF
ncbi:unnamed protein product [Pylaiella littoralis]